MNDKIERWLNHVVSFGFWEEDADGTIYVKGKVDLDKSPINKLPVKFSHIDGNFKGFSSHLTTLKGSPETIDGFFDCAQTRIINLTGAPSYVEDNFVCYSNKNLISLEGAPETVNGHFDCSDTSITSLRDMPKLVGGDFDCYHTKIWNNLWELRYALINHIGGEFSFDEGGSIDELINTYKFDGVDKRKPARGLMALKKLIERWY